MTTCIAFSSAQQSVKLGNKSFIIPDSSIAIYSAPYAPNIASICYFEIKNDTAYYYDLYYDAATLKTLLSVHIRKISLKDIDYTLLKLEKELFDIDHYYSYSFKIYDKNEESNEKMIRQVYKKTGANSYEFEESKYGIITIPFNKEEKAKKVFALIQSYQQ